MRHPLRYDPGVTNEDIAALEAEIARDVPGFAICYKDESKLQRLIGTLLKPFNGSYMTAYTTVMFRRIYFPDRAWHAAQDPRGLYCLLRHEAVHLRDMRRFPGLFQLSYLFLLPTVFTARAWWEWRAYKETIRAHAEVYGRVSDSLISGICDRFCGPDYLYMFPFRGVLQRGLAAVREEALGRTTG